MCARTTKPNSRMVCVCVCVFSVRDRVYTLLYSVCAYGLHYTTNGINSARSKELSYNKRFRDLFDFGANDGFGRLTRDLGAEITRNSRNTKYILQ